MKNKFRLLLLLLSISLVVFACKKDHGPAPDHSVNLTSDTLKVTTGTSKQIASQNYGADQLTWTSSDSTIAKVNNAGLVTGYKQGVAQVTVKSKTYGTSAICTVNVTEAKIIDVSSLTLAAGKTKQLLAQNYPQSEFVWTSSDTTIATVSDTGLITALKPGHVNITVKTKTFSVSETCNLTVTDAILTDVGVGADGSVFVLGADTVTTTGGHSIYKVVNGEFHKMADCAGIRIAVTPDGKPWVVNKSNLIFQYSNGKWQQMTGTATDIGIGADGSIFIIGTQFATVTGGNIIQKWNGSGWDTMQDCAGVHIAVDPHGTPWVVNQSNIVFQFGGTYLWNQIYGVAANDIGIGANGTVYVTGTILTTPGYNPGIYKYNNAGWTQLQGLSAISISVDAQGKIWYIDPTGVLHSY